MTEIKVRQIAFKYSNRLRPSVCRRMLLIALAVLFCGTASPADRAQAPNLAWHAATEKELHGLLPARAAVEKEHIETETRTASGITDGHGQYVAAIVLITAGYAADGKYSHYLVTQVPLQIGEVSLNPGEYVLGWDHLPESLNVHFYDAATGAPQGSTEARKILGAAQVVSIKIWPPQTRQKIQIGRFEMPYTLKK